MNRAATDTLPLLPFFLPASGGQRYCLLHLPPPGRSARGGIVYLHPLAEELNKSRHVAAAQARAFAAAGYSVLQIDLYGCGDSSGDFGDARWPIWHNDLHLACAWLAQRVDGPLTLWGLRLGALLALDFASRAQLPLARLLLWQPELDGRRCIDRFLRLRLARACSMAARRTLPARRAPNWPTAAPWKWRATCWPAPWRTPSTISMPAPCCPPCPCTGSITARRSRRAITDCP